MMVQSLLALALLGLGVVALPHDRAQAEADVMLLSRAKIPSGGVGARPSDPPPVYHTFTDYDYQSINLALYQEYIELDLFHHGLAQFSTEEFEAAGLHAEQRFLIQFMADQEVSHAELLSNMLGERAAKQCKYAYPFTTVRQFVDFCQKLTRFGESGVYGFVQHLNQRPVGDLLTLSIATEARQQMIFRQFAGAFPMPVHFETGIPQAWAWTLLSTYLTSCPSSNPHLEWQIFPSLNITNNPSIIDTLSDGKIVSYESGTRVYYPRNQSTGRNGTSQAGNSTGSSSIYLSALTTNRTSLSYPGREVHLKWDKPGKTTSYNNSYKTESDAGAPKYALWVSQLNATYTPLYNINMNARTASTRQPNGTVFPTGSSSYARHSNVPGATTSNNGIVNGTMFVAITDSNIKVTSYNLSLINPHMVAGPALYQAD